MLNIFTGRERIIESGFGLFRLPALSTSKHETIFIFDFLWKESVGLNERSEILTWLKVTYEINIFLVDSVLLFY